MAKGKKSKIHTEIPDLAAPRKGIINSTDELEYGIPGVVRILSGRGKGGRNGYFIGGFQAVFASEINEEIQFEETYVDHENLKIIIKIPDPADPSQKETIRSNRLREYTLGADDLKTRAAVVAFASLDEATKKSLISKEKEWTQAPKPKGLK